MNTTIFPIFLLICIFVFAIDGKNYAPEQIVLTLTGKTHNTHVVSYVTGSSVSRDSGYKSTPPSQVFYGLTPDSLNLMDSGKAKSWDKGGYAADVHVIEFTSLLPDKTYYYRVGVVDSKYPDGLSKIFSFSTSQIDTIAIYGDFGLDGLHLTQTYDSLISHLKDDTFQAIFHLGDISYNLEDQNGKIGDDFLQLMQPLSTAVPFLAIPGNHEKYSNFTHFKHRFRAQSIIGDNSKSGTQFYYSMNMNHAHFIFFDTEVYLIDNNKDQQKDQLAWLEADLKTYNTVENRKLYPWLITFAHKCDWHDKTDFTKFHTLLHNYGVDIHFCGHQHNYQRLFPGNQAYMIENNQELHRHINPHHIIQIVVGSPGPDADGIGHKTAPYPKGLANVLFTYGFGTLKIFNSTHLYFNYIETEVPHSFKKVQSDAHYVSAHLSMGPDAIENEVKKAMFREMFEANNHQVNDRIKDSVQDYLTLIQTNHGTRTPLHQDNLDAWVEATSLFHNMSKQHQHDLYYDSFAYAQYRQFRALSEYQSKQHGGTATDGDMIEEQNHITMMTNLYESSLNDPQQTPFTVHNPYNTISSNLLSKHKSRSKQLRNMHYSNHLSHQIDDQQNYFTQLHFTSTDGEHIRYNFPHSQTLYSEEDSN